MIKNCFFKRWEYTIDDSIFRVQDSMVLDEIENGFTITRYDELHANKKALGAEWWSEPWDEKANWHINPYAALPQWLSICSIK